jgi:hypothetical protein
MTSQCLDRRIDTLEKLKNELAAWQHDRNRNQKTVKWQFTTVVQRRCKQAGMMWDEKMLNICLR